MYPSCMQQVNEGVERLLKYPPTEVNLRLFPNKFISTRRMPPLSHLSIHPYVILILAKSAKSPFQ